jgi:hypothetical protein
MRQILIEKYIKPSEILDTVHYIVERWFNEDGELHSFMGHPAVLWYKKGDNIKLENKIWYKKGLRHREKDLPSSIFYKKEKEMSKIWYKNGEEYRAGNKPTLVEYDENRNAISQYKFLAF